MLKLQSLLLTSDFYFILPFLVIIIIKLTRATVDGTLTMGEPYH